MYKVLIVDDEPMVIHGLCRQIDWESYNLELVGTAETGESALSIIKQKTVDILFTDICMTKMNGLDLISAVKQVNPFLRSVVISSYSEFHYVKKALLLGVENYLLKPINHSELKKTLEKTIDNLNRDCISIRKKALGAESFRNNILDRWVNAEIQDYEFYERAELLQINFSARKHQVCVIDIINSDFEKQKMSYAQLLYESCQNTFSSEFAKECFIDRFNRVVIIFGGDELENKYNEIELNLSKISKNVNRNGIIMFASISPASDGIEYVPRDYSDAVEYLNYRFIEPNKEYIFYDEFLNESSKSGCRPILLQLSKALNENDTEKTNSTVKKLLEICSGVPLNTAKKYMISLLVMLVRLMNESGNMSDMLPSTATREFTALASIDSMNSLSQWLSNIITQSSEIMCNRIKSLHILVQRTLNIIKNEYHNTELSLKIIASDFKVSPAYLGQIFRNETGKYFNDYLSEVRLQASEVLLLETDLKIREILYRIGLTNQSYFNRVFKKAYGVSPLTFRHQNGCLEN